MTPTLFDVPEDAIYWRAFELSDEEPYIREHFSARYGVQPDEIKDAGSVQLAGPIPT